MQILPFFSPGFVLFTGLVRTRSLALAVRVATKIPHSVNAISMCRCAEEKDSTQKNDKKAKTVPVLAHGAFQNFLYDPYNAALQ